MSEESPSQSLLVTNLDPPLKVHPEECAWSDYFNNFENSKTDYFFSKQQICKVKDGIKVAKSLVSNLCKIIKVSSS